MVPSIDVMSDFSMSELVTLSISVVKSVFGMTKSSLYTDFKIANESYPMDFLYPHDNLECHPK